MYCKKFLPNIFHKTKCTNCFRQKEEHSFEALECNRPTRSVARSGYLFLAPDWDFSVPLNRTKRWQRRWFVLYDDGELKYSVDEHPDTIPQGSVDMCKVMEVTGAEQITGHPHSLALTSPDRVTFVKATSREDARWWAELLAVFPRRHKRNATFPGGRASPSLPQLGRSASPQPPRPRQLSCANTGPSPRTNFETPPLREEREIAQKTTTSLRLTTDNKQLSSTEYSTCDGGGLVEIEPSNSLIGNESYFISSCSPPTRDKLRCENKKRARRDWRNERLRDIATALTDRSPESSLTLPAESLLHLKKGWLWLRTDNKSLMRRWIVLSCPTLNIYRDQDEHCQTTEYSVELSTVVGCEEISTETKYGFAVEWSCGPTLVLCAVTAGIRSNWLQAIRRAAPALSLNSFKVAGSSSFAEEETILNRAQTPSRSSLLASSDEEEYRTASECGRQGSDEWCDLPPSTSPLHNSCNKTSIVKLPTTTTKDRIRIRPKLPRYQSSRQSTLDSTSTDELDAIKVTDLRDSEKQLAKTLIELQLLEEELKRCKKREDEAVSKEKHARDTIEMYQRLEKDLNQRYSQTELNFIKEQRTLQKRLVELEETAKLYEEKSTNFAKELQNKQRTVFNLQEELSSATERLTQSLRENEEIRAILKEIKGKIHLNRYVDSFTDLTNINLDLDIEKLEQSELKEYSLELRSRFEKAVLEIRAVKRELKESHEKSDSLELENCSLSDGIEIVKKESETQIQLLVSRLEHLTSKLTQVEKQNRNKLKTEVRDRQRSLSLKTDKECFSINKEFEEKVAELEMKVQLLERYQRSRRRFRREISSERNSPIDDKSLRRLRRKSIDGSSVSLEPIKLMKRLDTLDVTINNLRKESSSRTDFSDHKLDLTKSKVQDCLQHCKYLKSVVQTKRLTGYERFTSLEQILHDLVTILTDDENLKTELDVMNMSANVAVKQLHIILEEKFTALTDRRNTLFNRNELNDNARLQILAEKVAFENICINRLQEALLSMPFTENTAICDRLVNKELKETANLMLALKLKLKGDGETKSFKITNMTGVEYLTKVLTRCLISASQSSSQTTTTLFKHYRICKGPTLTLLQDEQKLLNALLVNYKATKLQQLAETLALETYRIEDNDSSHVAKKLTNSCRKVVNSALIQSEINHVLLKAAQIYQSRNDADNIYFFSFFACERASLELWSDSVNQCLMQLVQQTVDELTELYKISLNQLQSNSKQVARPVLYSSADNLMHEFADIIAHKALIDARISVLSDEHFHHQQEKENEELVQNDETIVESNRFVEWLNNDWHWEQLNMQTFVQMNQSLEVEFRCMFDSIISNSSNSNGNLPYFESIKDNLTQCFDSVSKLQTLQNCELQTSDHLTVKNWNDICLKCIILRNNLESICNAFKTPHNSIEEEEQQQQSMPKYLLQVETLRSTYRNAILACDIPEIKSQLEHLRLISERTILAVEQWHRRIIQELRQIYSKDVEVLREEKEQALAEETQATLAALDAMRKAHEADVQKELAKQRQELSRHQRNDFLDLSEQLSVKCMENVTLEEQLNTTAKKLSHAQQKIFKLERTK